MPIELELMPYYFSLVRGQGACERVTLMSCSDKAIGPKDK